LSINNEAIQVLAKEIAKTTKFMIKNANFDRTVKGRILSNLGDNYYQVQLNDGQIYKAMSFSTYNINEIVYIKIIENNYNNLIIENTISKTNESSTWSLEDTPLDIDLL
jgi:hypothetical protein